MSDIEYQASSCHGGACLGGFPFSLGRKGHVVPASKEVQFIPGALTMAKEDKFAEHTFIVGLGLHCRGNLRKIPALRAT
jgi:hypothetical protein